MKKETLYVRKPGEGPVFAALKLMCISDSRLYEYLVQTKEHSLNNPKSTKVTFLNVAFWKNILNTFKQHLIEKIVEEINMNGGIFSIQVDTTSDNAGKEQVSVVVKYALDSEQDGVSTVERTIVFKPIHKLSAKNLFHFVTECFRNIGLSIENVTGKRVYYLMARKLFIKNYVFKNHFMSLNTALDLCKRQI